MRRAEAAFTLCAACAALAGPRVASAQSPAPRVALLEINVVGMQSDVKTRFVGVLTQALRTAGYEVMDNEVALRKLQDAGVAPGCSVGSCLGDVERVLGARRVVVGGIGAAGSNYDIRLTLLDTHSGKLLAQAFEKCDICTVDEGLRTMSSVATTIAAKQLPPGDEDSKVTPPRESQVDKPPPPPPPPPPLRPRWWQRPATRWAAAGVSVAAIGAGIALVLADGGCVESVPAGVECHHFRDSASAGYALIGGGAVVGAGALWMFFSAAPADTRVTVGWSGHF